MQDIHQRPDDLNLEVHIRLAYAMTTGIYGSLAEERLLGQHTCLAVASLSSDAEQPAVSSSGLLRLTVFMRVSTPAFVLEDGMTRPCS